ncbi:hypothetical protein H072_4688 [Dactylellina haptotyla CBS 200.50]|uniref:DH domain-containing protein n=1 Tax=Dactylellina haptotyla (strain CBS 200.50) TaxID=1284197 RepID=S8AEG4_DACHA|nr:hypothetical protein H072_4688 [Dactylellina haptotyla CBS 200.50]
MEASTQVLTLNTCDIILQSDCESMETATQPVTPVDTVAGDQTAPQILVSQDDDDSFIDAPESIRRLSFSTEDSDYKNLSTPKFNTLRSRSSIRGDQGQGVMRRWMKSLRGKSKLPHIHYDMYRIQAARESVHGNLSIAPSAMTSATKLTGSTNFLGRVGTATASRMSLSFYGSVAGFSRRDAIDQMDIRAEDNLDDALDIATIERAQQRWKILAEIVLSEEEYIMDLKTMITAFTSQRENASTISNARTKRRIVDNMTDLLEYQEALLSELFTRLPASIALPTKPPGPNSSTSDIQISSHDNVADPSLVKSLADVFESRIPFFFAHIEYGANYEKLKELVNSYSGSPIEKRGWESGFEMLANAVSAECNKGSYMGKKAATLADLIIKPIHHVCRYPLLLNRLLDVTPTIDAPEANEPLQRIIKSLKDLGSELNSVQCNTSGSRDELEKTWLLREMISLPKEIDCLSGRVTIDRRKSILRHLGQVQLCGVLQVAYSTNDSPTVRYTIGSLFRTHLLLARPTVDPSTQKAVCSVMFMIPLAALKSDDIQDRSLPDAEFSWKVNFRKANRLYRIRLSAKTAEDAEVWRSSISSCIDKMATDSNPSTSHFNYLPHDIRARENEDKASMLDLRRQFSQAKSHIGLSRSRSQPLDMFSTNFKDDISTSSKQSPLAQQLSNKSLERFLRRNTDSGGSPVDRKEEAVSRLWPEQRNTLENLYSHVISTDILSSPMPKKNLPRRLNTMATRSMSASHVEEKGLIRKLSLSNIWQSRKRSSTPTTFDSPTLKHRPSRLLIPERTSSTRPKRSKSEYFGSSQTFALHFSRTASSNKIPQVDGENKENYAIHSKSPSRKQSLLHRFSPERHEVPSPTSTEPSTPSTTAPVSPVTLTSSLSEKSTFGVDFGISSYSLASMHGRIKKSFRSKSTLKKLFTG